MMHSRQGNVFFAFFHQIIPINTSQYDIGLPFLTESKNKLFYLFSGSVILAFFSLILIHGILIKLKNGPAKYVCYILAIVNLLKNIYGN